MKHSVFHSARRSWGWIAGAVLLAAGAGAGYRHYHQPVEVATIALPAAEIRANLIFDLAGRQMANLDDPSPEAIAVKREVAKLVEPSVVAAGGLRVYCTLDPDLQRLAVQAVERATAQTDGLKLSLLAMENETGAIRALVGTGVFSPELDESLRSEIGAQSAYANGGVIHRPSLVARVSGSTGDLLYQSAPDEERLLSSEQAWKVSERQQAEIGPVLAGLGWEKPTAGEANGNDDSQQARFIASTSALTCAVSVAPTSSETILARGHRRSLALPVWIEFMRAVPMRAYPAVAFQAPAETTPDEIPLVRRAVAVVQPEVRRAIPVEPPTIAFGGSEPAEMPVRRAMPVHSEDLIAQGTLVQGAHDDGVVSTGTGFYVFPRSVRRSGVSWSR